MTEEEWLECVDPKAMLEFLGGEASDRKLRLFAVACCRRFLHLTNDQRVSKALGIAELFADGLVGDVERSNARKSAQQAAQVRGLVARKDSPKWERRTASLAYYALARRAVEGAWNVPQLAVEVLVWHGGGYNKCDWQAIKKEEGAILSNLFRDIFGNLFYPITLAPSWLTPDVKNLAQSIYDDRYFDRLPILADELEKTGCDSQEILAHCRGPGPHVRGCRVVDRVLGKE